MKSFAFDGLEISKTVKDIKLEDTETRKIEQGEKIILSYMIDGLY